LHELNPFIVTITSTDPAVRDRSFDDLVAGLTTNTVVALCAELEGFRRDATNLYERVRASMLLHALFRYRLQESPDLPDTGLIPFGGFQDLWQRRFEQAIASFSAAAHREGYNSALTSALAQAYEQVTYQTLADQVRRSVQNCSGNRWMFRVGHADEHPLRIRPALLERDPACGQFPILCERTAVRLDLTHSAWSDIFFLGMDYPEGARVVNISVDLGIFGRDDQPLPPIETYIRVISEPVLRLTSIDLQDSKDVSTLQELFNFGNDYLGLVKAGIIASGLIPPSLEGTGVKLEEVLARLTGRDHGLEVVTKVNDIPKGSRLAVSTNLLASLASLLMRATGQARNLTGTLTAEELRVVVARAILGEWLGGSGGGWQDSGGIFPGVKLIQGAAAQPGDPEWEVSRGRLLPDHHFIAANENVPPAPSPPSQDSQNDSQTASHPDLPFGESGTLARGAPLAEALASSLVLVHGGMAQNVGPILNMVTEKYLLRGRQDTRLRQEALLIFEKIVSAVKVADVRSIGRLTTWNWGSPLKGMIPWVSNRFTELIIRDAQNRFGNDFWGFLMLGGMSGGGMGFFVAPHRQAEFRREIGAIMNHRKSELEDALPFAMQPVVYDFRINPHGTHATLMPGAEAVMPASYYPIQVSRMIAAGTPAVSVQRRRDLHLFANRQHTPEELIRVMRTMVHNLFPVSGPGGADASETNREAERLRLENGFDPVQHLQLRDDLQHGKIGLSRNRLPVDTEISDILDTDLILPGRDDTGRSRAVGAMAIRDGEVAVVSLAAGVGSRWTTGAGVVKAVNPFVQLAGEHRSFLEIHLAKTRQAERIFGGRIPHVVTTSFLTHGAIARHLDRTENYGQATQVYLSRGQSIGQRLIPMVRDLTFLWEESMHETLDENKQKVRAASRQAILDWTRATGEGTDYVDNVPLQRFNPPGHFYEIPNLLRNGVLATLLQEFPNLQWMMAHNIDTLGANVDPALFGLARQLGATLIFEVVPRRLDDRGGGLARVNGRPRILEGLASPREDAEFRLRYYNTLTTWVHIDGLLQAFGLARDDLSRNPTKVTDCIRRMAARVPTYVTIKDVKRRWGHGQEDIFPVAQFEKLWGDLTSIPDLPCAYLAVDRRRGQQLKDPAQLEGWARDGSRDHVLGLCDFA
jgi:galactokinase/mevalonate kinase-like predicted kinase